MEDGRSYGEKFATLSNNLRRRDRGNTIFTPTTPIEEPFLQPFKEVNELKVKLETGQIKRKEGHWTPVAKQTMDLESLTTVAAY